MEGLRARVRAVAWELAGVGLVGLATAWGYRLLIWPWRAPARWLTTDFTLQFYPWLYYGIKSVWAGVVPWWCALTGCGEPFLAKLETAPLFPAHLLLGLVCGGPPSLWAAQLYQVIMIWLGAVGVYCFCRAGAVGRAGAAVAGALFATSNELVYHSVYITFTDVLPLMGLIFAAAFMALTRREPWWLAVAGLGLGFSLLAGNPQWSLMHVMALALMWSCWAVDLRRLASPRQWWEVGWPLAVVVACGFMIALVQLGPSWELVGLSPRAATSLEFASMDRFPYPSNINAALNNFMFAWAGEIIFLAGVGAVIGWGRVALGLVGVGLCAMELARGADSPLFVVCYHLVPGFGLFRYPGRFIHLAVFAFSVLAAMGLEGLWRGAKRSRMMLAVGVGSGLAGLGWALGLGPGRGWALAVVVAGLGAVAGWAGERAWVRKAAVGGIVAVMVFCPVRKVLNSGRWVAQGESFYKITPIIRYLQRHVGNERISTPGALITHAQARAYWSYHRFKFLGGLIYSIPTWATAGQLHLRALDEVVRLTGYPRVYDLLGIRYLPQGLDRPPRPEGRYKTWMLKAGGRMQLALEGEGCGGVVEVSVQGQGELELVRGGGRKRAKFEGCSQLRAQLPPGDMLEVRVVKGSGRVVGVVAGAKQLLGGSDRWEKVMEGLWVNRWGLPKVFVVHRYELCPNPRQALKALVGLEPLRVVVLQRPPTYSPGGEPAPRPFVKLVHYQAHELVVECGLRQKGILVVLDSWYPGWKAWVDGRPAALLKADYMFRAVALGPGRHTVVMRYEPWWMGWIWLGPVVGLGLMGWVGLRARGWQWPTWGGRRAGKALRSG